MFTKENKKKKLATITAQTIVRLPQSYRNDLKFASKTFGFILTGSPGIPNLLTTAVPGGPGGPIGPGVPGGPFAPGGP